MAQEVFCGGRRKGGSSCLTKRTTERVGSATNVREVATGVRYVERSVCFGERSGESGCETTYWYSREEMDSVPCLLNRLCKRGCPWRGEMGWKKQNSLSSWAALHDNELQREGGKRRQGSQRMLSILS